MCAVQNINVGRERERDVTFLISCHVPPGLQRFRWPCRIGFDLGSFVHRCVHTHTHTLRHTQTLLVLQRHGTQSKLHVMDVKGIQMHSPGYFTYILDKSIFIFTISISLASRLNVFIFSVLSLLLLKNNVFRSTKNICAYVWRNNANGGTDFYLETTTRYT